MSEPFLNGDQILNRVFDKDNDVLKVSGGQSQGGQTTIVPPGRNALPIAAWKKGHEFGFLGIMVGDKIARCVRVISSED